MTDAEFAIERLTAWVRDYGDAKAKEFIGDLSLVLLCAKESMKQSALIHELNKALLIANGQAMYPPQEQSALVDELALLIERVVAVDGVFLDTLVFKIIDKSGVVLQSAALRRVGDAGLVKGENRFEATEMTNIEDVKELAAMVLEMRSDLDVLADAMRSLEKDNGGNTLIGNSINSKVGCSTSTNPADFIWQSEAPPDDDKRTEALRIIQTWAACDSESSETREEAMAAIVRKCKSALSRKGERLG